MASSEHRGLPWGQQFLIADDTARTGLEYYLLVIREDSVISVLSDATNTLNMVTAMGISGKTLKAGDKLFAKKGHKMTNTTFTSGSAWAYKEDI